MKNRKKYSSYLLLFLVSMFVVFTNVSAKGCDLKDIPLSLPIYISNVIKLIKILVPIILVVMGMIDFARATVASDEKQMKESQNRLIKRVLAAVIVFFVIAIVQFVFRAIGTDDNILGCIDCFVNGICTAEDVTDNCIEEAKKTCERSCSNAGSSYNYCYNQCFASENAECRGYTGCRTLVTQNTCEANSSCIWDDNVATNNCKDKTCENTCSISCYRSTGNSISEEFRTCYNNCKRQCND